MWKNGGRASLDPKKTLQYSADAGDIYRCGRETVDNNSITLFRRKKKAVSRFGKTLHHPMCGTGLPPSALVLHSHLPLKHYNLSTRPHPQSINPLLTPASGGGENLVTRVGCFSAMVTGSSGTCLGGLHVRVFYWGTGD